MDIRNYFTPKKDNIVKKNVDVIDIKGDVIDNNNNDNLIEQKIDDINDIKKNENDIDDNNINISNFLSNDNLTIHNNNNDDNNKEYILLPHELSTWDIYIVPNLQLLMNKKPEEVLTIDDFIDILKRIHDMDNDSISSLNASFPRRFHALYDIFVENDTNWDIFSNDIIPFLAKSVLELNDYFQPNTLYYITQYMQDNIIITQRQAFILLACSFFCILPEHSDKYQMPLNISFTYWLQSHQNIEKIYCLFNYFRRIKKRIENDNNWIGNNIIYSRKYLNKNDFNMDQKENWCNSMKQLSNFIIHHDGTIEDDAPNMLHADFANKYIGGGVLDSGCVQEEILFVINPECLISTMIFERMKFNESILICGTERYSSYDGYASSFEYSDNYIDNTPIVNKNNFKIRNKFIIAFDAKRLRSHEYKRQYNNGLIMRDITKCYIAFLESNEEILYQINDNILIENNDNTNDMICDTSLTIRDIATGNWGCGAFGGDPQLKSLLQWGVASEIGRNIHYFTFNDKRVQNLDLIIERILNNNLNVGQLFTLLFNYKKELRNKNKNKLSLFEYILRIIPINNSNNII